MIGMGIDTKCFFHLSIIKDDGKNRNPVVTDRENLLLTIFSSRDGGNYGWLFE